MKIPRFSTALGVVLTSALVSAAAAQPPVRDAGLSATAAVVAVEVPVEVTLDNRPLGDLTAANFEIYDGGVRQRLTGFERIDLAQNAAVPGAPPPPAAARRHFLLLLDLSFSQPSSLVKARRAAAEVVRSRLAPSDLVAVATYGAAQGARLVLGFTSDRRQVELALETLGLPQLVERSSDPLRLMLAAEVDSATNPLPKPPVGGDGVAGGAKAEAEVAAAVDQAILASLRDDEQATARSGRSYAANRASDLTRSLGELARALGRMSGRKYVVYLSEGFDASLLLGKQLTRDETASVESGDLAHVESDEQFGSGAALSRLEVMLEEFRRSGCVIQAVDIGGLRGSADTQATRIAGEQIEGDRSLSASGQDVLFTMAHDTGGELYRNFNDLGEAMGRMLQRTATTYLLTFQPPDPKPDGRYHRLEIKLVGAPRGARLSHRAGYYAQRPLVDQSPIERGLGTAEVLIGGAEGGALAMSLLASPLPPSGGRSLVPVVLEIGGTTLLAEHWGEDLPLEMYVYAFDQAGGVADFLAQTIQLDLGKVRAQLGAGGIKVLGELSLPAGKYTVRALARNGRTGSRALRSARVEVSAPSAAGLLTAPLFPQPAGRWLIARVGRQTAEGVVPFEPFRLDGAPFVPEIQPVLATDSEVQLLLFGAGLAEGEVTATLQVEHQSGAAAAAPAAQAVEAIPTALGDLERLPLLLPTAGLAPGEYRLRVRIRDAQGQEISAPAANFAVR